MVSPAKLARSPRVCQRPHIRPSDVSLNVYLELAKVKTRPSSESEPAMDRKRAGRWSGALASCGGPCARTPTAVPDSSTLSTTRMMCRPLPFHPSSPPQAPKYPAQRAGTADVGALILRVDGSGMLWLAASARILASPRVGCVAGAEAREDSCRQPCSHVITTKPIAAPTKMASAACHRFRRFARSGCGLASDGPPAAACAATA